MAKNNVQIKCINKLDRMNPHERITNVGGYTDKQWKLTQQVAVGYIEADEWGFWVSVGGKSVWVVVATSRYGFKYLKTQDDGETQDNLLSLPECP